MRSGVVCWHVRREAWVRIPGQTSKTKYEKKKLYFFGDFLLADFWEKTATKKYLKNL